jgi:hypothetical protein
MKSYSTIRMMITCSNANQARKQGIQIRTVKSACAGSNPSESGGKALLVWRVGESSSERRRQRLPAHERMVTSWATGRYV